MLDQAARHFLNCGVTGVVGCDLKSGCSGGVGVKDDINTVFK